MKIMQLLFGTLCYIYIYNMLERGDPPAQIDSQIDFKLEPKVKEFMAIA